MLDGYRQVTLSLKKKQRTFHIHIPAKGQGKYYYDLG